jgi:hypothetical protein
MDEAEQQRRIDAGNSIDLKWLRSFVVVADEGSFTTAAGPAARQPARARPPDPGPGAAARRPLLERLPRGVRLTPAGLTALRVLRSPRGIPAAGS